jgi:hypothetical protein
VRRSPAPLRWVFRPPKGTLNLIALGDTLRPYGPPPRSPLPGAGGYARRSSHAHDFPLVPPSLALNAARPLRTLPFRPFFPLAYLCPCPAEPTVPSDPGGRIHGAGRNLPKRRQGRRQRGLSARALRARFHGASPAPRLRSASHPLHCASLPPSAAPPSEMRRGGSRREPTLSPRCRLRRPPTPRGGGPSPIGSARPSSAPKANDAKSASDRAQACNFCAHCVTPVHALKWKPTVKCGAWAAPNKGRKLLGRRNGSSRSHSQLLHHRSH